MPLSPVIDVIATTCPDCGSEGPHDVYKYVGQFEFVCVRCGLQHTCPEDDDSDEVSYDERTSDHLGREVY